MSKTARTHERALRRAFELGQLSAQNADSESVLHQDAANDAFEKLEALIRETARPLPARPDNFEFAMDFLGDPEASVLRAYIEQLERAAGVETPNA